MGKKKSGALRAFKRSGALKFAAVVLTAVIAVTATVKLYDRITDGGRQNGGRYGTSAKYKDPSEQAKIDAAAVKALGKAEVPSYVTVNYINPSRARTCEKLTGIHNIVIHYTGNPGTTAKQNRSYFGQPDTLVCSHFLVGLDGEIIQCIPLDEQSAASNSRNVDTISVEICHPDESGRFNEKTYASAVKLTAWLCKTAGIGSDDLIRHHDITGKLCPKYFVEHPDRWQAFKADVEKELKTL